MNQFSEPSHEEITEFVQRLLAKYPQGTTKSYVYYGSNDPLLAQLGWTNYLSQNLPGYLVENGVLSNPQKNLEHLLLKLDSHKYDEAIESHDVTIFSFHSDKAVKLISGLKTQSKGIIIGDNTIIVDGTIIGPFQGQQSWAIAKTLFLSPMKPFTKKELYLISHPDEVESYERAKYERDIKPFHEKLKKSIDYIAEKIDKAGLSGQYKIIPNIDSYLLVILGS